MTKMRRTYDDARSRWAGVGPYYAMFPVEFANDTIDEYSSPGDLVLDPFAGRGTAVFSAATRGRRSIGIDVNPVGYVYGKTKLRAASQADVTKRLRGLREHATRFKEAGEALPEFFHWCFSPGIRSFLLAARAELDWRRRIVDRTTMALLLVYLHGKKGAALSNQLRQTKSMSPQYAVRWWQEKEHEPPDLDPLEFFKSRLAWRYARGTPDGSGGRMYLGDSGRRLGQLRREMEERSLGKARLLFTSPPYHAVTDYFYDQWLRLWLLGGPPHARRAGRSGTKYEGKKAYQRLLRRIFKAAARVLEDDAIVYVRTDSREFTYRTTVAILKQIYSDKKLIEIRRPLAGRSQTHLFGKTNQPRHADGEVDLIMVPR